jgi:hypothetical protein
LPGDPWDKPKAFDITDAVASGKAVYITIRVFKDRCVAGINGCLRLLLSEAE